MSEQVSLLKYKKHMAEVLRQSDHTISYMVIGLWLFGVLISFHYNTWTLGLGMGTLLFSMNLVAVRFFGTRLFSRMIGASVMALYMIQYLIQLHGLYEMHFWFFIMPIFLIIYQDWRVYIPFAAIIVIHHVSIYILINQGHPEYLRYFINMSELTDMTFAYHMGLAVVGVITAAWVAYRLNQQTKNRYLGAAQLEAQLDEMNALALNVEEVASRITNKSSQDKKHQSINMALVSLGEEFTNIIDNIIVETNQVVNSASRDGNLKARMLTKDKHGVWKDLSSSINSLLESIAVPVYRINDVAQNMSRGILTDRLSTDSKGDIQDMFENLNSALGSLRELTLKVDNGIKRIELATEEMLTSGHEMDISTNEIANAIAKMSAGAQNQLKDIEKTSNIIEQVVDAAKTMDSFVEEINGSAKKGVQNSEEGKNVVETVVSDIENIANYSDKTMESIQVLSTRSNEISGILNVISEIATQTNLLALNAAIEAAKAGEDGKGFAVVAENIRNLAEGAKRSTGEISLLVKAVQEDTDMAANLMKHMNENIKSGVNSTKKTHKILHVISESSKQTLELSNKVKDITDSQTKRISDVFNAIESVVLISEQFATGSEEVASSANELSNGMKDFNNNSQVLNTMGKELKTSMKQFTLN
ncbi:methyl-accepting chemotaxis protein [Reichenbachiella carrageenanivorans]|uniref:Methyl-accepting chemotaxis protein n=1 Tax=Reichenbachiella carrageenanivorans TaxID=2979869 RepID=A0ABY6D2G1_9BACT|nr:methyl-accepting chemotaxis protein [Reichenbachiella carrageenanivorans]UXX79258.1 methyl-accepting chemotaxis protein [Reichenbachiella carrageenanivorans]